MTAASRCTHEHTTLVRTASGLDVRLDDEVLTPLGELRAAVAGRTTYTRHTGSGEVHHRYPATIRARPAGTRPRQDVHAEHVCPDPRKVTR